VDSPAKWFASLPVLYGAAAAIFTDAAGRVLLVKPNYRDYWALPGGILEHGEAPEEGCAREVLEELGLDIKPGPFLAVGWTAPDGDRPNPGVHFLFDGGVLPDNPDIQLQAEELDEYRFVAAEELNQYIPDFMTPRILAALHARTSGVPAFISYPAR
jgi:8-oxo-dGTP diphosphatase